MTGKMIELRCEYLSVQRIWLHAIIMYNIHFRVSPVASKDFLDIQATKDCRLSLKHAHGMIRKYSQMYRTDQYSQHSSIMCSVWLNG